MRIKSPATRSLNGVRHFGVWWVRLPCVKSFWEKSLSKLGFYVFRWNLPGVSEWLGRAVIGRRHNRNLWPVLVKRQRWVYFWTHKGEVNLISLRITNSLQQIYSSRHYGLVSYHSQKVSEYNVNGSEAALCRNEIKSNISKRISKPIAVTINSTTFIKVQRTYVI